MIEDRDLLQLTERQSWIPSGAGYVRPNWLYSNRSEPFMSSPRSSPLDTSPLTLSAQIGHSSPRPIQALRPLRLLGGNGYLYATLDQAVAGTIQEVLQNVGDIAHVLQSFVTMSSGLTYYDQPPQFNGEPSTNQTMLIFVLTPVRHQDYMAAVVVFACSSGAYGCDRWAFDSRDKHLRCSKGVAVSSSS